MQDFWLRNYSYRLVLPVKLLVNCPELVAQLLPPSFPNGVVSQLLLRHLLLPLPVPEQPYPDLLLFLPGQLTTQEILQQLYFF